MTRHLRRNMRLLSHAVGQHLLDDPALLAIQVSRRLPMGARRFIGRAIRTAAARFPRGDGVAALGAFMAGHESTALGHVVAARKETSRTAAEVAVLLDRPDLLDASTPAGTRARALWARGDLSGAVEALESEGRGSTAQARRLRSELELLEDGHRLRPPASGAAHSAPSPERERLRVLHLITNSLPHTQSGYALRTHNVLTALDACGIESVALTRTGYPVMVGKPLCDDEDVIDEIRYRRTLPSPLGATAEDRLAQQVDEALRIVAEFRPHVLHATTDYRNALVAQAVSAATGIPWILEVRGLMEKTWIASHRSEASRAVAARSEKVRRTIDAEASLAREADAVVTLSRTMAEVLVERGVSRDRITLVPNGVDTRLLTEQRTPQEARARLHPSLPADALAVGAVSALVDYEGFDVLLRAVAALLADGDVATEVRDRLVVVLVGDGVSAPGLRALAEELGIEDRLHMPGRVPASRGRTWVQALDVVIVPRKDLEVSRTVTPQKPVEALALGRPVVVSDLPALRESVQDAHGHLAGVLAAPDDHESLAAAILAVLEDESRRRALSLEGRTVAAERTWPALMRRYESAYRAVIRGDNEETTSDE
ncbi:glycosyltransferase [Brachybacterium saurashtrense]|uniref:glycosyltransferase n=1 Tax=Brachybacterium saurashtrense TaxID=556288 RepID=UPI0013B37147|nr:glycosyltransferase [Brachybacterium saurashtrense]